MIDIQALLIEKLTDVVNDQRRDISHLERDLHDKYDNQSSELGRLRRVVSDMDQERRKLILERDALIIALKAAISGAPPAPEPPAESAPEPPATPTEPTTEFTSAPPEPTAESEPAAESKAEPEPAPDLVPE